MTNEMGIERVIMGIAHLIMGIYQPWMRVRAPIGSRRPGVLRRTGITDMGIMGIENLIMGIEQP